MPRAAATSIALAGGNLVFAGSDGYAGGTNYLVASTDLALPIALWTISAVFEPV